MESGFTLIQNCVCCSSRNLVEVLDLGLQPLANSYLKFPSSQEEFPLGVNVCLECWHLQLFCAVNPDILFRDYVYISGTTKSLRKYFQDFVSGVENNYLSVGKKFKVLEIASNDGSLLEIFKDNGHNVLGIDPALNLIQYSIAKGVVTLPGYFDGAISSLLNKFDIIIGMNVLAHVLNPKQFLINCQEIMGVDSTLIIQTSQGEMVELNQFDTIYHEHISFFNLNSFMELIKETNLTLTRVEKVPIHGSSWVWHLNLKSSNIKQDNSVEYFFEQQKRNLHLYEAKTYSQFKHNSLNLVNNVLQKISHFSEAGYTIVGYGAAAKGNTFLNFAKIQLDYIVEDNYLKWGLYSPGMNIPIKSPEFLMNDTRDILVLVPAWNFIDEITNSISRMNRKNKTTLLCYFPEIKIIEL